MLVVDQWAVESGAVSLARTRSTPTLTFWVVRSATCVGARKRPGEICQ